MYDCRYANMTGHQVKIKHQPEESGYAVYEQEGNYCLFSWVYGGMEKFEGVYDTLQEAIDDAESWT